jgi:hypothetical protein
MKRKVLALAAIAFFAQPIFGKSRNPDDYPQKAKVLSFSQKQEKTSLGCTDNSTGTDCDIHSKTYHILELEIEGQRYTVSCWRCDPLVPGQTYPARVDLKSMKVFVVHQKDSGKWGQDDYVITNMEAK